ncbi:MAG: GTP 3',8-cyclase MoaA [Myxococcales bacterium]|nr:GTP 3',8-cyclase MoaA [Myxococcales bacterium]
MQPPADTPGTLTDRWRRTITYLRISVTDRCNYRCAYCMPVEGFPVVEKAALLTFEEIQRFVDVMAARGVQRVRITGGEPLVRKGVVDLVASIARTPGIRQVALTTNGHLLDRLAGPLYAAGLRGLSVSLDTFDAAGFAAVTRGGDLATVLRGLAAAEAAGFEDIRINAVAARGVNDGELAPFVERCWAAGWLPRFIELMPIGGLDFQAEARRLDTDTILGAIAARHPLQPIGRACGGLPQGPARYHEVTAGPFAGHRVGLISPMSDDGFCAACNRARLTARGGLRACLADDREVPMLQALRDGAPRARIDHLIDEAVFGKREAHRMQSAADGFVPLAVMTGIGG